MKKGSLSGVLIIFFFFSTFCHAAPPTDSDIDGAVNSAESLFKAMKERDYRKIWSLVTVKSKDTIVEDIYKAEGARGRTDLTRQSISQDLGNGGPLCRSYWDGFLENFNPDTVLNQSKWDLGKFQKDRGEIVIKYRKSERPAVLQMYKEQGLWKTGLVETFWTRKPAS